MITDYSKATDAVTEVPENVHLNTIESREHTPEIELEYPEFQSLCPVSERHDAGIVTVRYKPDALILETKSVRDYLAAWRDLKNWQEYITEEIAEKLFDACEPVWLTVEIDWAPRGGIFARTLSERGDI